MRPRPSPTAAADPCDGLAAAATGATACKAIPAVANAINSPGGFKYSFLDYQTITGYNSGNPHLQPETAKTYTLGLVLTLTALRNFLTTIDYYHIKIEARAFRDSNSGKLTRIDQVSINTATMFASGVDLQSRYRVALPEAIGGSLSFALNWNWLQRLDVINQPGAPTIHYKGRIAETPGGVELPGRPANRVPSAAADE